MPAAPFRLVVLLSGAGTLLQALLDACGGPDVPAVVAAAGSDRPDAGGLDRARRAGVPVFVERPGDRPDRRAWDAALLGRVREHRPDLVVGAGFMRIVSAAFLAGLACPMINSHPSLLPAFPGAHAVRDALAAGVERTGATVHEVDAGVDTGRVLARDSVPVHRDDTEATLHERIKVAERRLLVDVVRRAATETTMPARNDEVSHE